MSDVTVETIKAARSLPSIALDPAKIAFVIWRADIRRVMGPGFVPNDEVLVPEKMPKHYLTLGREIVAEIKKPIG